MPSVPEFEYAYRWAEGLDVDALEARDQALEQKLLDGYGTECFVDFEYQYRWSQILELGDRAAQISMLEANMQALENAVTAAGGCSLEFPFRWSQFWEALVDGEPWAAGIAEENDRAIEFRFGRCSCFAGYSVVVGDNSCIERTTTEYIALADDTIVRVVSEGNNTSGLWAIDVLVNGSVEEHISIPSGPYSLEETVAIPIAPGDNIRMDVVSSFDSGTDTITLSSGSVSGVMVSTLESPSTPIGAANDYTFYTALLNSFDPTDVNTVDTDTVPGSDTIVPNTAVSTSIPLSSSSAIFHLDGFNDSVSTTSSFDVTSFTTTFTKTGTYPMAVTVNISNKDGGETTVTETFTTAGAHSMTVPVEEPGPFSGPWTGGDFSFITVETGPANNVPCIDFIRLLIEGSEADEIIGWFSA